MARPVFDGAGGGAEERGTQGQEWPQQLIPFIIPIMIEATASI